MGIWTDALCGPGGLGLEMGRGIGMGMGISIGDGAFVNGTIVGRVIAHRSRGSAQCRRRVSCDLPELLPDCVLQHIVLDRILMLALIGVTTLCVALNINVGITACCNTHLVGGYADEEHLARNGRFPLTVT